MQSLGLVSLTLIHVIPRWRMAKGHLHAILVKHNMFYYACGLGESELAYIYTRISDNYRSKSSLDH